MTYFLSLFDRLCSPHPPLLAPSNTSFASLAQVDSWSRNAYRNALATGPLLAPVNTHLLAAPTAAERAAWIELIERVKLPHPKQQAKVRTRLADASSPTTCTSTRAHSKLTPSLL